MASVINFEKLLAVKDTSMSSYLGYTHILSELYSNPNVWDLYTHLKRTNKRYGAAYSSPNCRFNDLRKAKCGLDYNLSLLKQKADGEKILNKQCDIECGNNSVDKWSDRRVGLHESQSDDTEDSDLMEVSKMD